MISTRIILQINLIAISRVTMQFGGASACDELMRDYFEIYQVERDDLNNYFLKCSNRRVLSNNYVQNADSVLLRMQSLSYPIDQRRLYKRDRRCLKHVRRNLTDASSRPRRLRASSSHTQLIIYSSYVLAALTLVNRIERPSLRGERTNTCIPQYVIDDKI
ncbi:hypothetical protein WN51_09261 [Melipona quadrifasciata]|uniref:Uncharacterized protein n=1 Tax=Melipona quadrifasciata TaxID=166423 RepID=A0A0M9A5E8_9HYME|nr:hypothetical protein WN51_09261 [Melipona quadrifasciata]